MAYVIKSGGSYLVAWDGMLATWGGQKRAIRYTKSHARQTMDRWNLSATIIRLRPKMTLPEVVEIVSTQIAKEKAERDPVNPDYYKSHPSGVECATIVGAFPFLRGAAIGYIWRAGEKTPDPIPDLRKAIRSLELEIARLEAKE